MGLVAAIFCFIIGIPMFLGGLGLTGWGAQQYMKATPADMDQWTQDARQLYHDRCIEYYGQNGTVYRANPRLFDDDIMFNEAKQLEEQKRCIDVDLTNAIENKNTLRNEGITKMFIGGIIMLFAFLLMWGGNRTRKPKEVRIKYDKGS